MSLVASQQEGDIELGDLEPVEHTQPLQELHTDPNAPSDADELTTRGDYRYRSTQPGLLINPSAQRRASDHSTTYLLSNSSSAPTTRTTERTTHSIGIASSQPSRSLNDQSQFLSGEVVPHTGKDKGRIPDIGQEPSIQFASHYFGRDAQFERRLYHRKKYQRLQSEARYVCTAVRRDKCRVHGRLFQQRSAQQQAIEDFEVGDVVTFGFVNDMFELDESAGACGTVYDLSDLAEEAGQAAEKKRERDWITTVWLDGMWILFILALGIAAIVGYVVRGT